MILDAANGAELLRSPTTAGAGRRRGRRRGDQIAYLRVAGQVVDLQMAQLEGSGPAWTVKDTVGLTDSAGLDGVSRPDWYVAAGRHPRAASEPPAGVAVRVVTGTPYLDRLAARTAATGTVLCLGIDPDPDALPAGFPATLDGVERFAGCCSRRRRPTPPPSSPTSRSSRRTGRPGIAVLERLRALVPADGPVHRRREARRHRDDRAAPGRRRCTTPSGRTP